MRFAIVILLAIAAVSFPAQDRIEDNSFLIEEAYNQESGVIQFINTFRRDRSGAWGYTFTNELPVGSQKHQFSYTIPVGNSGSGTGFGDIALNYRYQAVLTKKVAVSPRATVLLPSGSRRKELGTGGVGLQFNLPVSVLLADKWVTHINGGATFTPRAKNAAGDKGATSDFFAGQSLIFLLRKDFNIMFEALYENRQRIVGPGVKSRENAVTLNPGIRWAHNFKNGLQIVPGISVPLGVGPSSGDRGLFLYLSFER